MNDDISLETLADGSRQWTITGKTEARLESLGKKAHEAKKVFMQASGIDDAITNYVMLKKQQEFQKALEAAIGGESNNITMDVGSPLVVRETRDGFDRKTNGQDFVIISGNVAKEIVRAYSRARKLEFRSKLVDAEALMTQALLWKAIYAATGIRGNETTFNFELDVSRFDNTGEIEVLECNPSRGPAL